MQLDHFCDRFLRSKAEDEDRLLAVEQIKRFICTRESDLLQLVSALGDYLTHEDSALRSKSMLLLQQVLHGLPKDFLNKQQTSVMTSFFTSRLSDEVCLMETLTALVAIARMKNCSIEDAKTTTLSILQLTQDSPSLPQRVRFQIYAVLEVIMAQRRQALVQLKSKFINGFIDFMSGEKDPRNLMLAFSITKVILEEFEIEDSLQDLFDMIYCYFPITFRPPPDEPSAITTDDLKHRLRDSLCATPLFAPLLLPALLEKINAVAVSVKKDSLITLQYSTERYSPEVLAPFTHSLWQSLKYEIIQSEDGLLEELAVDVLRSITASYANDMEDMPKDSPLSRWLQPIIIECLEQLREPELKSAKPCGKILYSVSSASILCTEIVIKAVLPGLIALCQECQSSSKLITLIDVLSGLLRAVATMATKSDQHEISRLMSVLVSVRSDLFALLLGALMREQSDSFLLKQASLSCLRSLVQARHILDERHLSNLTQHLSTLLWDERQELCEESLKTLEYVAAIRVQLILDISVPVLLAQLPQEDTCIATSFTESILDATARLSNRKEVMDCLIIRLLSRVQLCLDKGPVAQDYLLQLLDALLKGLKHFCGTASVSLEQFYDKLVIPLYRIAFASKETTLTHPKALAKTAEIVNIVCRQCPKSKQEQIARDILSVFISDEPNDLLEQQAIHFRNLERVDGAQHPGDLRVLFLYTLAAMKRDVAIVARPGPDFFAQVLRAYTRTPEASQRQTLCKLMKLILNKAVDDEWVSQLLDKVTAELDPTAKNLDVLFAVANALILRGHVRYKDYLQTIAKDLTDSDQGRATACRFQELLQDDTLLHKENFACIKLLSRQRCYAYIVPHLTGILNSCNASLRPHYLIALSRVISLTPRTVILPDISSILPVLLECLQLSEIDTRRVAITTIDSVLVDCSDNIGTHLSTLIPSLLLCIQRTDSTPPRTRMAALHLLGSLVDVIRNDRIQPFKARVIRALSDSLDDKKRTVRREAVATRQKYFTTL